MSILQVLTSQEAISPRHIGKLYCVARQANGINERHVTIVNIYLVEV